MSLLRIHREKGTKKAPSASKADGAKKEFGWFYPITVSSVRTKAHLREFASHERWERAKFRTSPCSPSLAAGASYMAEMDGVQII